MTTVKEINHDSSTTLSDFYSSITDTDGAITVNVASALGGSTNGLEMDYDAGANTVILAETFTFSATELRVRFRLNINTYAQSGASTQPVKVKLITSNSGFEPFVIQMAWDKDLTVVTEDDGGTSSSGTSHTFTATDTCVEFRAIRASSTVANDGVFEVFVDGASVIDVSNLDNFNVWNDGIDTMQVEFASPAQYSGTLYYDQWILDNDESVELCASLNAFRFLGFAADNENLYASGLKDAATLKLYDYDLPTLTEGGTASFGSGTDAELDALTRGIFPVVKPMADQVLYLRGRDGNNVQVQYNDQNGTLGWVDIGPGTATWGTAKYAVGLLTAPTYTDDVIAVFSDDDVYRTRFGTVTWVKMGDAGSGLRAAVRHPNRFNEIMVGGTAAGTVEWSNNFGASFGDVSGTALGTVNSFEVSL
jgi:hypothetical protein